MAKENSAFKSRKTFDSTSKPRTYWLDFALLNLSSSKPISYVIHTEAETDFRSEIDSFLVYYPILRKQIAAPISLLQVLHFANKPALVAERLAKLVERMQANENSSLLLDYCEADNSYLFCIDLHKCGNFLTMKEIGYDNLLEAFNSLKLPDVNKFAGDISSTKRNELLEASIQATEKSLPKIFGLVVEKYVAAELQITEEQAVQLLENAPKRIRHNLVKRITPELFPELVSKDIRVEVPSHIQGYRDLKALEIQWFSRLVFQGKEHNRENLQAWLNKIAGLEIEDFSEKQGYIEAIRHTCKELQVQLFHNKKCCSISIKQFNSPAGLIRLLDAESKQHIYAATKFPRMTVR